MNAALGTLPFLATLWLVAVLGAKVLEESGAKIAAALKGKRAPMQPITSVRLRMGVGTQLPMRAKTQLRAAA
jgi:hypothetical protein